MLFKTIIFMCIVSIFTASCSLKSQTQSITVLVKIEECEGTKCDGVSYQYDDKRKEVFEQNKPEFRFQDLDPRINPDPIPRPKSIGDTKSINLKPTAMVSGPKEPGNVVVLKGPAFPLGPDSSITKYNKSGKIEKDEWDTDGDQIMDMYYLSLLSKINENSILHQVKTSS